MALVRGFFVSALLILLIWSPPLRAQTETDIDAREAEIASAAELLLSIQEAVEADGVDDVEKTRETLRDLIEESRRRRTTIEDELARLRERINLLGAAPGENEPPEAASIAEQRSSLSAKISLLESQLLRAQANASDAASTLDRIARSRLAAFYADLSKSGRSLLDPSLWRAALTGRRNGRVFFVRVCEELGGRGSRSHDGAGYRLDDRSHSGLRSCCLDPCIGGCGKSSSHRSVSSRRHKADGSPARG